MARASLSRPRTVASSGGSVGISFASTLVTRREQFHQGNLVEYLQPVDPAFTHFSQQLSQATPGNAPDVTAQAFQLVVQQSTLLSYLDAFKAVAIVFLALLPLLLLVKPGTASATAHAA